MTAMNIHVRGSLIPDAPLGAEGWFGCGGNAEWLFQPADDDDLAAFLAGHAGDLTVLGGMANTIIRDGGVPGVTLRLGRPFADVQVLEGGYIRAGAGALNGTVAAAAMKAGIGGLEFLSGIPGTIGGALRMNAGAYGAEMKDALIGVNAFDRSGNSLRLAVADLNMSYRHTDTARAAVFTSAHLRGKSEDYETVRARMNDIKTRRNETQPIREKTGGSTFANPAPEELRRAGLPENLRAWQIVEKADGRGLRVGGAQMSELHCNFMINTGRATAADLETLGEELRARVRDRLGLDLRWEIRRTGLQDKQ